MGSPRAVTFRTIRAVKIVVRDGRIPRPLRWGGAVGLLPVPGPFDEVVLLLVGGLLWLFYRNRLREAWQRADGSGLERIWERADLDETDLVTVRDKVLKYIKNTYLKRVDAPVGAEPRLICWMELNDGK